MNKHIIRLISIACLITTFTTQILPVYADGAVAVILNAGEQKLFEFDENSELVASYLFNYDQNRTYRNADTGATVNGKRIGGGSHLYANKILVDGDSEYRMGEVMEANTYHYPAFLYAQHNDDSFKLHGFTGEHIDGYKLTYYYPEEIESMLKNFDGTLNVSYCVPVVEEGFFGLSNWVTDAPCYDYTNEQVWGFQYVITKLEARGYQTTYLVGQMGVREQQVMPVVKEKIWDKISGVKPGESVTGRYHSPTDKNTPDYEAVVEDMTQPYKESYSGIKGLGSASEGYLSIDINGAEREFEADEEIFYREIAQAKGHVIVNIYNKLAKFSTTISFDMQ